jgi:hypothetical protein
MAKIDKTLIGKIIKVELPQTYYKGSKIHTERSYIVGKCDFAGFNWILGKKQVTVNRMPIYPVDEVDITVM